MIRGLDLFRDYFRDFKEQYVIIGGAACDIVFVEADLSFSAKFVDRMCKSYLAIHHVNTYTSA